MSISKAEILAAVNANLNRTETDIDVQIKAALKLLSGAVDVLMDIDVSQSLVAGSASIAYPTDHKKVKSIVLNDGTIDGEPLEEITYEKYLRKMRGRTASDYNEPEFYAEFNRKFYLYPVVDASYTPKISYFKYHTDTLTTILFSDEWRCPIYDLATYFTAKKFKLTSYLEIYGTDDNSALGKVLSIIGMNTQKQVEEISK